MVELVIVVAIFLIVAAMAVPVMRNLRDSYQLNVSGRDVSAMLLQTRAIAVHANQPYYAQITAVPGSLASAQSASQLSGGAAPVPDPNPAVSTEGLVTFQTGGLPDHTQLDTFVGGTPAAAQINGVVAFNARGIPCGPGTLPTNFFSCPASAIGFEWFMQSSVSNQWEAVTVTPAGRVRSWRQGSSGTWQ